MLSKVNKDNLFLGTVNIQNYAKNNKFTQIQDNLNGFLLVKNKEDTYLYNYKLNKKYKHNRIQIHFNNYVICKQIESFDQNNIMIANKIRRYVLSLCKDYYDSILGIGGEYYLYFPFIKANKYIGISNHKSIVDDAYYNIPFSINYLVDYNKINLKIEIVDLIILNVFNLHINIIEFIKKIKFKKLIIISCNLPKNKFNLLINNFKIKHIEYFNDSLNVYFLYTL
jgi:hypothetical protein